jgi:hypothetical protein
VNFFTHRNRHVPTLSVGCATDGWIKGTDEHWIDSLPFYTINASCQEMEKTSEEDW